MVLTLDAYFYVFFQKNYFQGPLKNVLYGFFLQISFIHLSTKGCSKPQSNMPQSNMPLGKKPLGKMPRQ